MPLFNPTQPLNGAAGSLFDDFWQAPLTASAYSGPFYWLGSVASGTLAYVTVTDASAIGVVQLSTTTSATGRAGLFTGLTQLRFGGIAQSLTTRFQFPSSLFNGTEQGAAYIGFIDLQTAAPTDGAYIYWDNSQTNFRYRTRNNSTETDSDSGLAPVADTWYAATITANAAGTSVQFTIEANASRATPIAGLNSVAIATNIPTASGRETGIGVNIIKAAGTTARLMNIDYVRYGWGGQ